MVITPLREGALRGDLLPPLQAHVKPKEFIADGRVAKFAAPEKHSRLRDRSKAVPMTAHGPYSSGIVASRPGEGSRSAGSGVHNHKVIQESALPVPLRCVQTIKR
jgi:hypothetical protein